MNFLIIFAVIAVLAMVIITAMTNRENRKADFQRKEREQAPIKSRSILTTNEQMTFLKLRKALPDCFVLTQVALSALLNSNGLVTRNKITRCRADFVILDKEFNVISIVEVDQSNQNSNTAKISERDTMLMEAGYRVTRYAHSPDIERIISDFSKTIPNKKSIQPRSPPQVKNLLDDDDSFFDHDF